MARVAIHSSAAQAAGAAAIALDQHRQEVGDFRDRHVAHGGEGERAEAAVADRVDRHRPHPNDLILEAEPEPHGRGQLEDAGQVGAVGFGAEEDDDRMDRQPVLETIRTL